MASNVIEVRCLLISPSDVKEEREAVAAAVTSWNAHMGPSLNARIELVRWEIHASPDLSGEAQSILNRQIVDGCDFGVAVFWTRVGTATSRSTSGSMEEIERLRTLKRRVLLYFSTKPAESPRSRQYSRLRALRAHLEREGLVAYFDDAAALAYALQSHLTDAVKETLELAPRARLTTPLAQMLASGSQIRMSDRWPLNAVPLASREQLYSKIVDVIDSCVGPLHVRATSSLHDRDRYSDDPFRRYVEAVARRCGECSREGVASSYTLIVSFTLGKNRLPPSPRLESLRYRTRAFESAGALESVQLFQLPHFGYLDILTVGDEHAFVGFPARANDPRLRYAIWLSGREFASQISHWFDTCILPYSKSIDKHTLRVSP